MKKGDMWDITDEAYSNHIICCGLRDYGTCPLVCNRQVVARLFVGVQITKGHGHVGYTIGFCALHAQQTVDILKARTKRKKAAHAKNYLRDVLAWRR